MEEKSMSEKEGCRMRKNRIKITMSINCFYHLDKIVFLFYSDIFFFFLENRQRSYPVNFRTKSSISYLDNDYFFPTPVSAEIHKKKKDFQRFVKIKLHV